MSEQHWGARPDSMWWPNVSTSDQQNAQHQQMMLQHQHETVASTPGSQPNLFSYKVSNSFETPQTLTLTSSSSPVGVREYDYRLGGGNPAMGNQWWYPTSTLDNMHSMPPVQTPPSPQLTEAQARQEEAHRQQEAVHRQQEAVHRHQEAQRQQQEAVQRHQEAHLHHQQETQRQQEAFQQHHQALVEAAQRQRNQHIQQQVLHQQLSQQQSQVHQQPVQQTKGRMPRAKADSRPRGRMTAYAFFVQTCREEHKKKHPEENVVFAEFSRKCAERWKTMLDKEKKRFHEMAEGDKKRYDAEMQNYTPPKGEKQRGKKRKQIKDPNAPKRSLSAFFWFSNDERGKVKAENPEYGVGDIAKELGRRWADCDPETKGRFEQLADKDKQRYEKEMTAYKKKQQNLLAAPQVPEEEEEEEEVDDEDDE